MQFAAGAVVLITVTNRRRCTCQKKRNNEQFTDPYVNTKGGEEEYPQYCKARLMYTSQLLISSLPTLA